MGVVYCNSKRCAVAHFARTSEGNYRARRAPVIELASWTIGDTPPLRDIVPIDGNSHEGGRLPREHGRY
jgi:hypothetical protein